MPVDHLVEALVSVGQQAVVARAHAPFPPSGWFVDTQVGTSLRVEMHDLQGCPGRPWQRSRVIDQAASRAGPPFRALYDQGAPPPVRIRQTLAGQLAVFQLE